MLFFVLIFGLVSGAQWHRLYLFPFPQLHELVNPTDLVQQENEKIIISIYEKQLPVFSDRPYYDSVGDYRLDNSFLLQISRHRSKNITIESNAGVTIYRFISNDNLNKGVSGWHITDIPINIEGQSTTHTRVVKKFFHPGKIILEPGGPVASSPILIRPENYIAQPLGFKVLN